jgi:hypothetical protein
MASEEYHDLAADPYELRNTYASLTAGRKAELHALSDNVKNFHGADDCNAATSLMSPDSRHHSRSDPSG